MSFSSFPVSGCEDIDTEGELKDPLEMLLRAFANFPANLILIFVCQYHI